MPFFFIDNLVRLYLRDSLFLLVNCSIVGPAAGGRLPITSEEECRGTPSIPDRRS